MDWLHDCKLDLVCPLIKRHYCQNEHCNIIYHGFGNHTMRAWWWSKSASTFQEWNRTSAWTGKPRENIPGLTTSVGRVKIKKKVILLFRAVF